MRNSAFQYFGEFLFDKSSVTDAWPLIRYLLDDPVYWDRYVALLTENYATVLAPEALIARIRTHAELLAPVSTLDMSQEEYDAAVQKLVDFVEGRAVEVERFLQEQGMESTAVTLVDAGAAAAAEGESNRPPGWTDETHSNDVDPNYAVVFPIDAVNTMTITLAPDDWAAMQADMEEMYGAARDGVNAANVLAAMSDEERAAYIAQRKAADAAAPAEDQRANASFSKPNPIWAPGTITFQG